MKVKILQGSIKSISQEEASILQYNLMLNKKIFNASIDQENGKIFLIYLPEGEKEVKEKISKILESIENEREEDYETIVARRYSPEITNEREEIVKRLKLPKNQNP
ncbi:MAG: hypothetical protein ACP5HJ_01180 [Candidatus Micrarchaeia archaeon]